MMRIYGLMIFLGVLLVFNACKTTQNTQGGSTARTTTKVKVPKDFAFSMSRTTCRGNCPGYSMTIDAKGNVVYEGQRNVKNIGKHTKTLTKDELKSLVATLEEAKFWDFADKYDDEYVADPPSCTMNCTMNGKQKMIFDRFKAPQELRDMEKKIEAIIGEEGFTKVAEEAPKE
ncbi:MAG: DUF6438 domain-containing protein [Bacteroidia bacterium]